MATIQASDVLPVRSRVSWSAILAGAVTALTIYIVLFSLGLALGASMSGRVEGSTLGVAGGIWALVSMLLALFCGGCVASRTTVGEDKTEAALSGLIVWGVFFSLLAAMTAGTLNTGLNAIVGAANTTASMRNAGALTEEDLKAAGFDAADMRASLENLRNNARNTEVSNKATAAMWWTFFGTLLSIGASVAGALAGAGPDLRFFNLGGRTRVGTAEQAEAVHR
jgi:hypothetical protein